MEWLLEVDEISHSLGVNERTSTAKNPRWIEVAMEKWHLS